MATYDDIKANLVALGFDNPSDTSIIGMQAQAIGEAIDITKVEFDNTEANITSIIQHQRYGTVDWYVAKAKAYQKGDTLTEDPDTLEMVYAVIDTTKQIVVQAAFEEDTMTLKVAKENSVGILLEMSNTTDPDGDGEDDMPDFEAYMTYFEIPQIPITKVSPLANIIDINILGSETIVSVYNTYNLTTVKQEISDAMIEFIKIFPYDSKFYIDDLISYIKTTVAGVKDFYIKQAILYLDSTDLIGSIVQGGNIALPAGYFNFKIVTTMLDYVKLFSYVYV